MSTSEIARIRRLGKVSEQANGCWLWLGFVDNVTGYGRVNSRGQRLAHRLFWVETNGVIPAGLEIDHVATRGCTSRACVNPAHMELVTHRENLLRGNTFARSNAAKTHCPKGHCYSPSNTYRIGKGGRACRACNAEKQRAWMSKPENLARQAEAARMKRAAKRAGTWVPKRHKEKIETPALTR